MQVEITKVIHHSGFLTEVRGTYGGSKPFTAGVTDPGNEDGGMTLERDGVEAGVETGEGATTRCEGGFTEAEADEIGSEVTRYLTKCGIPARYVGRGF
jgi:hypothetical protein